MRFEIYDPVHLAVGSVLVFIAYNGLQFVFSRRVGFSGVVQAVFLVNVELIGLLLVADGIFQVSERVRPIMRDFLAVDAVRDSVGSLFTARRQ